MTKTETGFLDSLGPAQRRIFWRNNNERGNKNGDERTKNGIMYLRKELNKILKKKERIKTVTITFDKNCNKNRKKKQIIVLMKILLKNN